MVVCKLWGDFAQASGACIMSDSSDEEPPAYYGLFDVAAPAVAKAVAKPTLTRAIARRYNASIAREAKARNQHNPCKILLQPL
jgi:hypothetical protein